VLIGALISLIGFLYYTGTVEFYSGIPPPESPTSIVFLPMEVWLGLGILVALLIAAIGFVSEPEFGFMLVSTVLGGLLMVSGYFLYEQFVLGVLAIAEVPVNVGQMTVGMIIATPIVRIVQRSLPQLRR
jgi:hypothetical protein